MGLPNLPRVVHHSAGPVVRAAVRVVAAFVASLGLAALTPSTRAAEDAVDQKVDFVKDVQPILQQSCVRCHRIPENAGGPLRGPAGGLRLDDKSAALRGGKHGKVIVPGSADESLLYKVLKGPAREVNPMPKAKLREEFKPLSDDQIQMIKLWIDQGAEWPEE